MGLALTAASQAAVLNRGHIVLRGPATELVAHPEQLAGAYLGTYPLVKPDLNRS